MAYGTLLTDTVQSSVSNTPTQFNDGNGTQVGTLCRAWVNFNGVTTLPTATIRASFNVSSVTRTGAGLYTINFTNAMPDAKYSAQICSDNTGNFPVNILSSAFNANYLQMNHWEGNYGGSIDTSVITVAIFR